MQDGEAGSISRNEFLFHHLVVMFQTLAFQQLGKLINPISGKMERDLQQARVTIDMLQMIQEKTAGNLTDREQNLIVGIITELQLNYVDELKRAEEPVAEAGGGEEEKGTDDAAAAPEEPGTTGAAAAREEGKTEPVKRKSKKRKTKAKKKRKSSENDRD